MAQSRKSAPHSCFKTSDLASARRWYLCSSRANLAAFPIQRVWTELHLLLELLDVQENTFSVGR